MRIGFSFFAGILIARELGPKGYGDFNFLLGSFTALIAFVDLGSSSAFYTFISQKKRGEKFYHYYIIWIMIQLFLIVILIYLMSNNLREKIWLGHSRDIILFALFSAFSMIVIWRQFVVRIGDSIRDTINIQIRNIVITLIYLLSVLILSRYSLISIKKLLFVNIFLYMVSSFFYGLRLYSNGNVFSQNNEKFKQLIIEYKDYCLPLMVAGTLGFLYSFADYWFLQKYGGSIQQGYYSIGARYSSIALLATSSILAILWKEIAEEKNMGNMERVRMLYTKILKSLYFFTAFVSCFFLPFTQELISLFYGESYKDAWLPTAVMFFYPLHQCIGQITSTMLQAIERTKTLSIINIIFIILSIPITYLLISPQSSFIPGLNLGSYGLALKMVACQFVFVNFLSYYTSKYINSYFDWSHQFIVLLLLIPLGFLVKTFSVLVLSVYLPANIFLVILLSGFLYLATILFLVYLFPTIAGIDITELRKIIDSVLRK